MPGQTTTSNERLLKRTVPRDKIDSAASAKEKNHGAKNHHWPLREKRNLACRQGRQRSATSRKHWHKQPGGSRTVPDTPAREAPTGERSTVFAESGAGAKPRPAT